MNSLSSNILVNTCLGNDMGFDQIFAKQLSVLGSKHDLLLVCHVAEILRILLKLCFKQGKWE